MKKFLSFLTISCLFCSIFLFSFSSDLPVVANGTEKTIKWVDFNIPYSLLVKTMELDIESYGTETHLDWIELLASLAAKYGGDFQSYQEKDLTALVEKCNQGEYIEHLAKGMKYYSYYYQAYSAVLSGFLGEYEVLLPVGEESTQKEWKSKYGLLAFSPIAEGFWYSDYDDFGAGRSYGYARKHLGHDLIVSTGTPIVAVESGTVEALGWNQYGGWRIGIRSLDQKRYYYYAHLKKETPYVIGLKEGQTVVAGDVIGYSGQTGYSIKENVNNIDTPHLHIGIQLIFKEEQKESQNEIWIDLYNITRLLSTHRASVLRDQASGEYRRAYEFHDLKMQTTEEVSLPTETEDIKNVPILMYHGLLKDGKMQNKFVIDPNFLESDLKYLKEHGYETIHMSQLIRFVKYEEALPPKPIILTFDDGYYNNYLYAYPLLQKYNAKATISIIGKCTEDFSVTDSNHPPYSHITWEQAKEMTNSGLVEIQNHTFNMHTCGSGRKGAAKLPDESLETYRKNLINDIGFLQRQILSNTGFLPNTFAYPFGKISEESKKIMKELGFEATLSCYEGINQFTKEKSAEDLYDLKRILRPTNVNSSDFFQTHEIL